MLDDSCKRQLDERGWLMLPGYMSRALLSELRGRVEELFAEEGARAGSEFKQEPGARRLANLVNKGEVFERVILAPDVLECTGHILGPRFKLSSLNARSPDPNNGCVQPLHADAGAIADELGYWVANSVWMLDDFTAGNGALRAVPGSHRWRKLPQQALADPTAPHPDEQLITAAAGTVVVMNAHLWHGATANCTTGPRRAVHGFYTRWDKPQQQYQKRLLSPEVQGRLTAEARRILALDDPLNDRLSSAVTGMSGFMK
jgi:hypothetical protein